MVVDTVKTPPKPDPAEGICMGAKEMKHHAQTAARSHCQLECSVIMQTLEHRNNEDAAGIISDSTP